ncbi:hypothetical protein Cni_G04506 [Canna indica]|uniref:Uncharacterized protein n=1 Tax=Canna indica TaxID=4628 RepID=A0AAQ3Q4J9_9LILI|nr:hypothetical protein Cni_G04506 [Canna indica]
MSKTGLVWGGWMILTSHPPAIRHLFMATSKSCMPNSAVDTSVLRLDNDREPNSLFFCSCCGFKMSVFKYDIFDYHGALWVQEDTLFPFKSCSEFNLSKKASFLDIQMYIAIFHDVGLSMNQNYTKHELIDFANEIDRGKPLKIYGFVCF